MKEPLPIELITTRGREPLTLHPCWQIELYLDDVYPGLVNRISLAIWADTGEVDSCIPLSIGGGFPLEQITEYSPQPAYSTLPPLEIIVLIATVTVITIAFVAIVIKKKHH